MYGAQFEHSSYEKKKISIYKEIFTHIFFFFKQGLLPQKISLGLDDGDLRDLPNNLRQNISRALEPLIPSICHFILYEFKAKFQQLANFCTQFRGLLSIIKNINIY